MGANGLDNLSSRWHDAERCESAAIDHGLTIYQYRVLAIAPVNHLDIDPQVTSQLRRHTGSVKTRQSIRAITNDNLGHLGLTVRVRSCFSFHRITDFPIKVCRLNSESLVIRRER